MVSYFLYFLNKNFYGVTIKLNILTVLNLTDNKRIGKNLITDILFELLNSHIAYLIAWYNNRNTVCNIEATLLAHSLYFLYNFVIKLANIKDAIHQILCLQTNFIMLQYSDNDIIAKKILYKMKGDPTYET